MPMFRSATPQVGVIGMIAKAISKALMATTGARVKITLSANGGVQSSLKNIFEHVGSDLEHAERTNAVRTVTVLPPGRAGDARRS